MTILRRLIAGLHSLFHKTQMEREMDEELRGYLDNATEQKILTGLSRQDAARSARVEMGSPEAVKDWIRDVGWQSLVESFWQDLRYAGRMLRTSPGFAAVAVLTLALGIGANTAIFTLVDAVLLTNLPVENPQQLVVLDIITARGERQNLSYPLFEQIRDEVDAFSGVFAALDGVNRMDVAGPGSGGRSEEARVQLVSGEYFPVLGVRALMGRTLAPDDNRPGGEPGVAVLSYGFWKRRFAGDPAVIGASLVIKRQPVTIVGVTPDGFFGESVGRAPDIWVPLVMQPRFARGMSLLDRPNVGWLRVVGRLRPGATESTADAALALAVAGTQSERTDFSKYARRRTTLRSSDGSRGLPDFRQRFSLPLRILAGIVAIVLLIACANVANLLLARAAARQREMGVRLAIGAGRRRLVRQLFTESLLLAALGGVLGLLVAWWGSRVLLVLASSDSAPIPIDVALNARVLAFTSALSLVTVVVFGLAPALTVSRVDVGTALKLNAGTQTRARLSRSLLVTQVALSLVLLTGAALFGQTLRNLRTRDLGFAPAALVEVRIAPQASGYKPDELPDLSRRLVDRLKSAPGVESAAFTHAGFGGGISTTCCVAVAGYAHDPNEDRMIRTLGIAPGYFHAMRLPLLRGRDFTAQDGEADPNNVTVAVVNEAFVRRYVEGRDPIGTRLGWGNLPNVKYAIEIVGVAKDAVYEDLREEIKPLIYFPFSWGDTFVVRAAGPPDAVMATLRREVQAVDGNLESSMRTVADALDRAVVREKLLSRLSTFFGILATVLAGIGLYGLMAYAVVRRTREIGIRMALGAARGVVLRSELRSAIRLVAAGIAVGVPLAVAVGRLVRSQLFGISGTDPVTFAMATALLALVAGAAAYLPARRASRVDPIIALRWE
jgi:predicted permease